VTTEAINIQINGSGNFKSVFAQASKGLKDLAMAHKGLAVASVATTAVIVASVKEYAKFERQLAKVNTMLTLGESRFMPRYKRGLMDLASASGQATDTLADGLFDILSASRGAEGALEVLAETTKGAVAGFTDVATATDGTLSILNSFKLANEDVTRVLDLQFATVKRGRLTYEQYAQGIGRLATTSSVSGQSIEAMNAAVATVTRSGIRAEEAFTAINRALITFLKPAPKAQEAAEGLGIQLNQAAIEGDNLGKTLQDLAQLSATELASVFRDVRSFKAISVLTKDLSGFLKDLELQYDSTGDAAEAYGKASDTLGFQVEKLGEKLKNAARIIGEPFSDALKASLKTINNLIEGRSELDEQPKEWLRAQIKILVALKSARDLTSEESTLLAGLVKQFESVLALETEIDRFKTRATHLTEKQVDASKDLVAQETQLSELAKSLAEKRGSALQTALELRAKLNSEEKKAALFNTNAFEGLLTISGDLTEEARKELSLREQIAAANLKNKDTMALGLRLAKDFVEQQREAAKAGLGPAFQTTRGGTSTGLVGGETDLFAGENGLDDTSERNAQLLSAHESFRMAQQEIDAGYFASLAGMLEDQRSLSQITYDNINQAMIGALGSGFDTIRDDFVLLLDDQQKLGGEKFWKRLKTSAIKEMVGGFTDIGKEYAKSLIGMSAADKVRLAKQAALERIARSVQLESDMFANQARAFSAAYASTAAIPLIGPALAPAAGAKALADVIAGTASLRTAANAAHGGIDNVPNLDAGNRTFLLKGGERVLQPEANKDLTSFLKVFQERQENNVNVNTGSHTFIVKVGERELSDIMVEVVNEAAGDGKLAFEPNRVSI
jgi:TP901 family phage tail tape measure protein